MKPTIQEFGKAIETLTQYNLWRRDDNVPNSQEMPNPKDIGLAIEVSLKALKFARAMMNPSDDVLREARIAKFGVGRIGLPPIPQNRYMELEIKSATEQAWEEVITPYIDGETLEDCPFCGLPADTNITPDKQGKYYSVGCLIGFVGDNKHKMEGCGITFSATTKEKARALWNRRT